MHTRTHARTHTHTHTHTRIYSLYIKYIFYIIIYIRCFFITLLASTFRKYKITCKNILVYQFLLNIDIIGMECIL